MSWFSCGRKMDRDPVYVPPQRKEAGFSIGIDDIDEMIVIETADGRIQQINRKAQQVLGYSNEAVKDHSLAFIAVPREKESPSSASASAPQEASGLKKKEVCLVTRAMGPKFIAEVTRVLKATPGRESFYITTIKDMSHQVAAIQPIRESARREVARAKADAQAAVAQAHQDYLRFLVNTQALATKQMSASMKLGNLVIEHGVRNPQDPGLPQMHAECEALFISSMNMHKLGGSKFDVTKLSSGPFNPYEIFPPSKLSVLQRYLLIRNSFEPQQNFIGPYFELNRVLNRLLEIVISHSRPRTLISVDIISVIDLGSQERIFFEFEITSPCLNIPGEILTKLNYPPIGGVVDSEFLAARGFDYWHEVLGLAKGTLKVTANNHVISELAPDGIQVNRSYSNCKLCLTIPLNIPKPAAQPQASAPAPAAADEAKE